METTAQPEDIWVVKYDRSVLAQQYHIYLGEKPHLQAEIIEGVWRPPTQRLMEICINASTLLFPHLQRIKVNEPFRVKIVMAGPREKGGFWMVRNKNNYGDYRFNLEDKPVYDRFFGVWFNEKPFVKSFPSEVAHLFLPESLRSERGEDPRRLKLVKVTE